MKSVKKFIYRYCHDAYAIDIPAHSYGFGNVEISIELYSI